LTALVIATNVNDVDHDELDEFKASAAGICADVLAARTDCGPPDMDGVDDRVSMKLPDEAGEKLAAVTSEPTELPKTPSVVEKVLGKQTGGACVLVVTPADGNDKEASDDVVEEAAEAPADEPTALPSAPSEPTEAPAAPSAPSDAPIGNSTDDAAVEGIADANIPTDAATPDPPAPATTDAAANDTAVLPSDSASQLSDASTTAEKKMDLVLDAIILAHNQINARVDDLAKLLLKTVPDSGKHSIDTKLFFGHVHSGGQRSELRAKSEQAHKPFDLAALVEAAKKRHAL
jgi:hypothetical protein